MKVDNQTPKRHTLNTIQPRYRGEKVVMEKCHQKYKYKI